MSCTAEARDSHDPSQTFKPTVFKTYPDGYTVRGMTEHDAKIVQKWFSELTIIAPDDLDVALSVFPPDNGFYIGEFEGQVVASAVRLPWGNVFYGSYYYVHKSFRSRGFGTRLRDQVALEYVGDKILCIDAITGSVAQKNVAKFGYVEAFITQKFTTKCAKSTYGSSCEGTLVPVNQVPFQEMIDFDNKHFVACNDPIRRKFLEKWFKIPGGCTIVCLDPSGKVVGYGNRRPPVEYQPGNHLVGPLYAETPEVARAILQELCRGVAGEAVFLNVWSPNVASLKMMEDFGFTKQFDIVRMHLNGNPGEFKDTVYCITNLSTCGF